MWPAALLAGLALIVVGLLQLGGSIAPQAPAGAVTPATLIAERQPPRQPRPQAHKAKARPVPRPHRIVIPRVGVSATIVSVGLDAHRALHVPANPSLAGWYRLGPRPGQRGPAIIVGHIDSQTGPAVFYRLGALRRGDLIRIVRRDGSTVRFHVEGVERAHKNSFPTRRVYAPTARPALRVITCGGPFDAATGHYRDNTIVYAVEA